MRQISDSSALFGLYGEPSSSQAFPLVLQHVAAAIVGCVVPAIIISGTTGLSLVDKVFLVQAVLAVSGLPTLLQLFLISDKDSIHIGSALLAIMDISFTCVPSMQATAGHEGGLGIPMILGAKIVGGIVAILVGFSVKKIRKLPPPSITGTVVFTIGLSLRPTVVNCMTDGAEKPLASEIGKLGFGSWQSWTVMLITLAVVTVLSHYTRGILRLASILMDVIVGYIAAPYFGLAGFPGVATARLFRFPTPLHFGVIFGPSACTVIGLLFTISSIQTIGDSSATTTGPMDRMSEDKGLQGGIICYGISNIVDAVLGGLPTAIYSRNVGIVVTTRVINRIVLGSTAAILLVADPIPKFSAVLTAIPRCVLSSTTISVFASIVMTGIKLVMTKRMNYRNTFVVGFSVALGTSATRVANSLAASPDRATTIFGKSPIVVATCVAILLNVIPLKENAQKAE